MLIACPFSRADWGIKENREGERERGGKKKESFAAVSSRDNIQREELEERSRQLGKRS